MKKLKTFLETKKCFKLICGAGNENLQEVERLVAVYAAAGCRFFDLGVNKKILEAAQRGLDFVIPKEEQKNYHFCISIGTKGDRHLMKARRQKGKKASCLGCDQCVNICPQKAIMTAGAQEGKRADIKIIEKFCIGCGKCVKVCSQNLITMESYKNSACLLVFLPPCPLACIELHASDTDEQEVDEIWDYLNEIFDGPDKILSLCLGRQNLSDEAVSTRIKRLVAKRKPYTTIIQADGMPMSGGEDDFETTRAAVEMGKLVQSLNLPVYLLLSGGTNSKTAELARLEGVDINGVAVGSYARKIVKKYIEREDFWENKAIFEEASKIASKLIESTYMGFKI